MCEIISFESKPLKWNAERPCKAGEWQPVEFYTPAQDGCYLCYFGNGNMGFSETMVVNYTAADKKWWCGNDLPTHWMLLPETPVN